MEEFSTYKLLPWFQTWRNPICNIIFKIFAQLVFPELVAGLMIITLVITKKKFDWLNLVFYNCLNVYVLSSFK